jgi:ribonuclease D
MDSNGKLARPVLITDAEALQRLARTLSTHTQVAVDTESNSLYAYQERVCLMQFSIPGVDFLVDPLAVKNLSPLGNFFRDTTIEKIFHAAEYDLICLKRDFDFEFANLFDTMVAARILGKKGLGLGSLLASEFDIHIEKKYQRANWGQRPLPEHLLHYAMLDTHYLQALRERLHTELEKSQLLALAQEDFRRLCQVNGKNGQNKNPDCWRVNGAHDLHPQNAAVLRELCNYRDQVARAMNRPLFKVFNDTTLIGLAEKCPTNLDELGKIHGMSQRQVKRHGQALLNVIQTGLKARPIYPKHAPRPSDRYLYRVDALRNWRKNTARNLGVQSDVILPRDLMYELVEKEPKDIGELKEILNEVPWRLEHFGEQIINVLA